jgi:hypothetical protein
VLCCVEGLSIVVVIDGDTDTDTDMDIGGDRGIADVLDGLGSFLLSSRSLSGEPMGDTVPVELSLRAYRAAGAEAEAEAEAVPL